MDDQFFYVPRNKGQKLVQQAYLQHDIIICLGPAGSGKTHAAVAPALQTVMGRKSKVRRILLARPQVEAGEEMGFLPGDLNEKMAPWVAPVCDVIRTMTHIKSEVIFKEYIEVVPLAFMRGRTFDRAVAILDEAQNCTMSQLRMFLTRVGEHGKLILCGDPEQSDVGDGYALEDVADALEGLAITDSDGKVHSVGVVRFTDADIIRHPLIGAILDKLHDKD